MQRPADTNARCLDQLVCEAANVIQNLEPGEVDAPFVPLIFASAGEPEHQARHAGYFDRDFTFRVELEVIL